VLDHYAVKPDQHHIGTWTLEQKIHQMMTAPVSDYIHCKRHGGCLCKLLPSDLDISGFPCVDYSPAGKQLGVHGSSFPALLALCAWHRQRRTKLALLENVPEFPISVLEALMGDLYVVKPFYMEPSDSGCEFLSRMRVFILLMLRGQGASQNYTSILRWLCLATPPPVGKLLGLELW